MKKLNRWESKTVLDYWREAALISTATFFVAFVMAVVFTGWWCDGF